MKLLIFALILAISLAGIAVWCGNAIAEDCDRFLLWLRGEHDADEITARWEAFTSKAAFVTPYDLIRTGDANCENYVALLEANADSPDLAAARRLLESSIREIRRIHTLSWELIF